MNKLLLIIATLFAFSGLFAQRTALPNTANQSPSNYNLKNLNGQQIQGRLVVNDSAWINGNQVLIPNGNVGIGTVTPAGKFHVVDNPMNALFDSTGIYLLVGNDTFFISESGINAFSNIGGGSGYLASLQDTLVNFQVNRGDTIGEYINYGWAWGLAGSTASADSVARLRWDGIARAWKFAIDGGNTVLKINADDETVEIPDLAGSGTRLVAASATGVLEANITSLAAWQTDVLGNIWVYADSVGGGDNILIGSPNSTANQAATDAIASIAIGQNAQVNNGAVGAIAIGLGAQADSSNCIAIGLATGAIGDGSVAINTNGGIAAGGGIAIGVNATASAGQIVFATGNTNTSLLQLGHNGAADVSIKIGQVGGTNTASNDLILCGGVGTGTGTPGELLFQTSPTVASGSTIQTLITAGKFDASTTAGDTRFFLYDVDNGTLERVTVGAADSGGAGFKVLRIPN